ncbi:hypothetical protein XA68_17011 [Ophiocordyceps unilateralis]|uniref:Uncharacterized protein n=1 Tax=Ophiocordyceps unilateralis TaxID=268505 RepID=A0A2A9P5I9_OPHUN|nr:hypothetical protein XA68_17011 [Ophiocordyceps unilateralis]
MRFRPLRSSVHERPAPGLGRPRHQHLEEPEAPTGHVSRQLRMAKARVDAVDRHRQGRRRMTLGQGPHAQHLQQLGDGVVLGPAGRGGRRRALVDGLQYLARRGRLLRELGVAVRGRGDNGQRRPRPELGCRLVELGHQQGGQEKGRDEVDRHHLLVSLRQHEPGPGEARVGQYHVHPLQLVLYPRGEPLHAIVAGHVQLPHFHGRLRHACFHVCLGRRALFRTADGQNQPAGPEPGIMSRCFLAEARIAAGDDDGFPAIGASRVRHRLDELVV